MTDAPKPDAASPATPGLGQRVAAAAAWMVALRWLDRLIGLVSVAVLARLLLPSDFGVVACATLVIGLLELLTGLSTDAELIRHQNAPRDYFDAAWTMNLMKGVVLAAAMIVLAPAAATFFAEPRVFDVMLALAALPLIQGAENVGVVAFRKQLRFDLEFRFLLTSRLLGTLAVIVLALALRTYWALVAGSLLRAAIRVGLSYRVHPFRPRLSFARVAEIFRFSRWMMLQSLASGLVDRIPPLVVGREFDPSTLAYYNIGKEIADLAATEIRAPIRRALYPGMSRLVHRGDALESALVDSTAMMTTLTFPIPLGTALVAVDLVPLVLGTQWSATVALLQPLAIAGAIHAIGTNSHLAYMATNRSHLIAIAAWAKVVLVAALIAVLLPRYGVQGVAYATPLASAMVVVIDYGMSARLLGIASRRFVAAVWRPVVAGLVMSAVVLGLRSAAPIADDATGHAWSLARSAVAGALVYVAALLVLWTAAGRPDGAERRIARACAQALRRRGPRRAPRHR